MLRDYLESYVRHNRTSVALLAAISFVASAMLGLVVGVAHMLVVDYLARMAYLGEAPSVTGSTIAFASVTAISAPLSSSCSKSAFGVAMSARIRQLGILKSIGANDGQVKRLLLAEGCALSLLKQPPWRSRGHGALTRGRRSCARAHRRFPRL